MENLADIYHTELGLFDGAGMTPAELRELDAKMYHAQRDATIMIQHAPDLDMRGLRDDAIYVRREANRAFFAQWGR
jgi:hypothetical protein